MLWEGQREKRTVDTWGRSQTLLLHCTTWHSQLASHSQECRLVPLHSVYIHITVSNNKYKAFIFHFGHEIGLQRCGKSCRLRWTNYLRPDLKHGQFSDSEEQTIVKLHSVFGNRCIERYPTFKLLSIAYLIDYLYLIVP